MTEERRLRIREYQRKWRAANPEKSKEKSRKWRASHPEKVREQSLRRVSNAESRQRQREYNKIWYQKNAEKIKENTDPKKRADIRLRSIYGMSLREVHILTLLQQSVCSICGEVKKLVVDHSHQTGQWRGLLCHSCNTGIGHLRDNPVFLQSAIDYLARAAARPEARPAA